MPAVTNVNRNAVKIVFLITLILVLLQTLACISNFVPSEYRGGLKSYVLAESPEIITNKTAHFVDFKYRYASPVVIDESV
jgi:hypothetical protein